MRKVLAVLVVAAAVPVLAPASPDRTADRYEPDRECMVSRQIRSRGVLDKKVLAAMEKVPRHRFVPKRLMDNAYEDHALPIGEGQTISQPYIVALMTEALDVEGDDHVLEIGTGSGYQAAVLAELARKVTTMEIKKRLHKRATETLSSQGIANVETIHGDGYFGWPDSAPYDGIMITAAVDHVPPPLLKQLKDGAKLILPRGNPFMYQNLVVITKRGGNFETKQLIGVVFVPLTGYALEGKE